MTAQDTSKPVMVKNGTLLLRGEPVTGFEILEEVGRGANGIVFKVTNTLLDRPEALKIWVKLRSEDLRDKIQQGMLEARRTSAAAPEHSAAIHYAGVVGGIFYASMEYVEGETLKILLSKKADGQYSRRVNFATAYHDALRAITKNGLLHGDPHWSNVLLVRRVAHLSLDAAPLAKFVDFGTSRFTKKQDYNARHWRVVEQQFDRIFAIFPKYEMIKADVSRMFPSKVFHDTKKDFYLELMLYMMDQLLLHMQSGDDD